MFIFFQAEDGIRDDLVTGVQTCALPICRRKPRCLVQDCQTLPLGFLGNPVPGIEASTYLGMSTGSIFQLLSAYHPHAIANPHDPMFANCEVLSTLFAICEEFKAVRSRKQMLNPALPPPCLHSPVD